MTIKGTIYDIFETEIILQKYRRRMFVVQTGQGSIKGEKIPFILNGHKVSFLDGFSIGQYVEVNFQLRGREWDTQTDEGSKYFLTAEARGIENIENPYNPMSQPIPQINLSKL